MKLKKFKNALVVVLVEIKMTKSELIKLLEQVPDDGEIVVNGYSCDILGDYNFNGDIQIYEDEAMKSDRGSLKMTISNYVDEDDKSVKVWVLQ